MWEMNMRNTEDVDAYFNKVAATLNKFDRESMMKFADMLLETYNKAGRIYIFGNGGSGANASHFCGDFLKGVSYGLEKRFQVVCLNDNIPAMLAIANDISYEDVFIEQLKNFVNKEDLVIGISGSGNSKNIVKAMEFAKNIGAGTVALCGYDGGKIKQIADVSLHANINDMEVSEDMHLIFIHCVKNIIKSRLH